MQYILPAVIAAVIIFAIKSRTDAYSAFVEGAEDGLKIVVKIMPPLLAVLSASQMLRASGAFDMIIRFIAPVTDFLHISRAVMPLALIRPVSGSGALGVLADILNTFGADSKEGLTASVIMGSTETTFYCLCVYFAGTKVKYTRKVLLCAVISDIIGILAGVWIINLKSF